MATKKTKKKSKATKKSKAQAKAPAKSPARTQTQKAKPGAKTEKQSRNAALIDLAARIGELGTMTLAQLQATHKQVFGKPTKAKDKTSLAKKLAAELRARAKAQPAGDKTAAGNAPGASGTARPKGASRKKRPRDPRLPAPGTVLKKDFRGQTLKVTVLEENFEFNGRQYSSLSKIASEVAGCSWNGFVFFQLAPRPARKALPAS